jgi:hypothetical protein
MNRGILCFDMGLHFLGDPSTQIRGVSELNGLVNYND